MSFRELRNFNERMRALGYPQLISIENFTNPNFELVAHALYWLVRRYDPDAEISDSIEEEADRVLFVRQACSLFASKARLKLNVKRIYEARNFAVRELLKIADMLWRASKAAINQTDDSDAAVQLPVHLRQLQPARDLAMQITQSGAKLFDLLGNERELRAPRQEALEFLESFSRNLDSDNEQLFIQKKIRELMASEEGNVEEMTQMVENLRATQTSLREKLRRKQTEIENSERRLEGLAKVRPGYMDDYQRLEEELGFLYGDYVDKFRNLEYLETELDYHTKREEKAMQQHIKVICDFGTHNRPEFIGDQDLQRQPQRNVTGGLEASSDEEEAVSDEDEEEEEEDEDEDDESAGSEDLHQF